MGFCNLDIKSEYRSLTDDVIADFYVPTLKHAVLYKRAVGFFSSSALIEVSFGITGLVKNNGRIMIIASPRLQPEDIEAIAKGYEERARVIECAVLAAITEPRNFFEEERLNLLANLIARGHLDIKLAFVQRRRGIGIYHEKMGIMYDNDNNMIAFSGSMNETSTAFMYNYEAIDVFCSWTHDGMRAKAKESAFDNLWNDSDTSVRTIEFPNVALEKLQKYTKGSMDMEIDDLEFSPRTTGVVPRIPEKVRLHDYQLEAIDAWAEHDYQGIFDMATGTGKTYTALGAIAKLFRYCQSKLAVVIVCPYQHLVEQWVEDIELFGMKPIVGYSSSKQRKWKDRLKDAVIDFNAGIRAHFCFVTTNATFASKFVRGQMAVLKGEVVLVVDEAHNFGAENLSKVMISEIPYRLALSATIERHRDDEGTEKLFSYFGERCITYPLERAIREGKLTPYYYYPKLVNLEDDELMEYRAITRSIVKNCSKDSKGRITINERGKLLLIKRARIVAGARDKLIKLKELMVPFQNDSHILVYCGAASVRDPGYREGDVDDFEMRQIDAVSSLLGNDLDMRIAQFTSAENREKRELLKTEFAQGRHIQALVAIRCLDEGMNIPSIKVVFILASSTNPKEYVQRRGRVLRKFPGKNHAVIYDMITLPRPVEIAALTHEDELRADLSLVKRELSRMRDFAAIAENPADTDRLVLEIEKGYGLTRIGGDDYEI